MMARHRAWQPDCVEEDAVEHLKRPYGTSWLRQILSFRQHLLRSIIRAQGKWDVDRLEECPEKSSAKTRNNLETSP